MNQKTVLVVEDEKDIREALADMLRDGLYDVLEAKNGREGVELALARHPDLILLDLLMPEMDGKEAFKRIRADAWGRTARIMILTNVNIGSEQFLEHEGTHEPLGYLIKSDWSITRVLEKVRNALASPETMQ